MKHIILASMVAIMISGTAHADLLRCNVEIKKWCDASKCNEGVGGGEYSLVNTNNGTYSLCVSGKDDCQILQILEASPSGAFRLIKFGGSSFIKIAILTDDFSGLKKGRFMEVRDSMLGVISSFGTCMSLR